MRLTSFICAGIFAVISIAPRPVLAWHKLGHMEVALIAYDEIHKSDPALCGKLVDILRQHPRYAADFDNQLPFELNDDAKGQWLFCLAANWPDYVRPTPGLSGPPAVPGDPASRSSYHRASWHFINFPYAIPQAQAEQLEAQARTNLNLGTDAPDKEALDLNAIQALRLNSRILKTSQDPKEQAVALCWVLHLIGDLHQPLHGVALYTPVRFAPGPGDRAAGDRGGNSIAWATKPDSNLHWVWDDAPGTTDEAGQLSRVRQATDGWMRTMNVQELKTAANNLDPAEWANEDAAIAKSEVYTDEIVTRILATDQNSDRGKPILQDWDPKSYVAKIKPTAMKRVAEAGYRAAAWLKENGP